MSRRLLGACPSSRLAPIDRSTQELPGNVRMGTSGGRQFRKHAEHCRRELKGPLSEIALVASGHTGVACARYASEAEPETPANRSRAGRRPANSAIHVVRTDRIFCDLFFSFFFSATSQLPHFPTYFCLLPSDF